MRAPRPRPRLPAAKAVWRTALAAALALGWLIVPPAAAEVPASAPPRPQQTAEGTVRALYGDAAFLQLRNAIPPPLLQRFGACFTPDLRRHLESHHREVERWLARHADDTLKLPMAEGPVFHSNYEGADSFAIGPASLDGTHAQVPVAFTYSAGADTVRWVDIVLLRRIGGVWLLDDIRFDPQRWDRYSLRERMALDE